ncbi:MAG: O-antigen ligase family protein [Candidatus Blackburnbacteria bacterium]|nr:O-antigen ligase family protein [Candidatus Blackburnbacteria bacterium]
MSLQKLHSLADTILARSFYLLFFLVPLIFTPLNSELFEFPKMLLTYALTLIIVSAWATKSIIAGKFIFRRTLLDIPLLLFLASQLLSTFYSLDPHTSIWGYYSRSHGGLLSGVSYLLLYWAYVSNMDYKKTLSSIFYLLSSASIVAVWGILEHFGRSPSCLILRGNFDTSCWIQDAKTRVFATLGQPNWMAAWLVAIMPLAWQKLINANSGESKANKKFLYSLIAVFFFAALLFTKSRSGLLGFAVASAVFWAISFLHSNKQVLRPFFLLITYCLLLIAIFGSPWTPTLLEQRTQNIEQRVDGGTVLEQGGTESADIRKIVWKGALNIFTAYPIFGSGVETFAYSYYQFRPVEHNLTSEWDFLYNKAHNEYLNFLATTGILGLTSYLSIIATFLLWCVHKLIIAHSRPFAEIRANSLLVTSILAGYVSMLVTNFFGFSVVTTATLFFLFPAMAVAGTQDKAKNSLTRLLATRHLGFRINEFTSLRVTLVLAVLLFTFYLLLRLAQIWQADVFYREATELEAQGESWAAAQNAEKAVTLRPDEPVYYNELAKSLGHLAVSFAEAREETQAVDFAQKAIEAQDRAVSVSPMNLNFLKARSALFVDLVSVDPKYLADAALTIEKAVEIAPTEPKVLYNLGVLYDRLGRTREASLVFQKALELKPNYEDARNALQTVAKKL